MTLTKNQRIQAQVNLIKVLRAKQLQDTLQKPDWITDEQWKAVPSISWWEDQKQGAEYIKQSKPRTTQEVQAQFSRLRSERNWNQEE
jgi:hypothetical protein